MQGHPTPASDPSGTGLRLQTGSVCLPLTVIAVLLVICLSMQPTLRAVEGEIAKEVSREQVADAQRQAVQFFHQQVAVRGGYVYQVTSDLKLREGEGDAGPSAVWVQPPGTPAVGLAFIEAFERTGDEYLLAAARDAAACLLKGQLHSGGWQNHIDFESGLREKLAYRVDGPMRKKARNLSSFDDDQTQSALRFLIKVDRALRFEDAPIHEAAQFGLKAVVRNQFPNGAWPQVFDNQDPNADYPTLPASYPDSWPREYPGGDYWHYYTLNDQALVRTMQTMWLAGEVYENAEYSDSALRAVDFLLQAQMPQPQPAWTQQYNYQMQPVWARKFEPPAVNGGESQVVIEALMEMALLTGERKVLAPLPRALDYLEKCKLPDGRLARFYELKTNRPLYFNTKYELTYDDSDLPTHYGFKVENRVESLQARYEKLKALTSNELRALAQKEQAQRERQAPSAAAVEKIIAAMNERGAWVEKGRLRYIKNVPAEQNLILSQTFSHNLEQLSRFLTKTKQ